MKPLYLVITPFFPSPTSWRGPFVYDQVRSIERDGRYDVVVMRPVTCWEDVSDYEVGGVRVHSFRTLEMPSYFFNGLTDGLNARLMLRRLRQLDIDLDAIHVVHAHTPNAAACGLYLRSLCPTIRVVVQHHCLDPLLLLNGKLAGWWPNVRYRARTALHIFNEVDLHLSISEAVQRNLMAFPQARAEETYTPYLHRLKQVVGFPAVRLRAYKIVENGVDTSLFYPASRPKEASPVFRIGCIANFQPLKDHITLLRAFHRLVLEGYTDFRLSLIGTGETRSMCEQYLASHDLTSYVEWHDEMRHESLPGYYRTLDLFVLPSLFEGFGCVCAEASACGVPFMMCRHQGAAELIAEAENDRWLFAPHDDKALASLISRFHAQRYSQHLKKPVDIDQILSPYLSFLETL